MPWQKTVAADTVTTSDTTNIQLPLQDSLTAVLPASADSINGSLLDDEKEVLITKSFVEYFNEPYFAMSGATGPIVGTVSKLDTAAVNFLLERYKDIFPADVRFKWGFKPIDERETYFQLYALKGDGSKRGPALGGDVVTNARADQGQQGSGWEVTMTMNSAGASRWSTITGAEVGKSIAIVLDNYVYSAPTVNGRIDGGRSSITGNFTPQEAQDLENVLKSGKCKPAYALCRKMWWVPHWDRKQSGTVLFRLSLR